MLRTTAIKVLCLLGLIALLIILSVEVVSPATMINLATQTKGILGSTHGGAGTISGALKGNGSGTVSQAACGDLSNASGGCTMSTTAGGDLSGTLPSPTVAKVNGGSLPASATIAATDTSSKVVAAALPNADIYVGNSSNLPVALAMSGDCTIGNTGVVSCTKLSGAFFQISGPASSIKTFTFPNADSTISQTIASGAKALATGAISSATCTTAQTDTATGTATTDSIAVSFNGDPTAVTGYIPLTTGMLTIIVYPTADTVNFKVCNNTLASITPGAITINWRVVR